MGTNPHDVRKAAHPNKQFQSRRNYIMDLTLTTGRATRLVADSRRDPTRNGAAANKDSQEAVHAKIIGRYSEKPDSQLFGQERGAFTSALSQQVGRFQLTDRGTLFLDEIGEVSLELQPKLLRVLQSTNELKFRPIVDSIPGLVFTTNAAGEVVLLNRQVPEYFGKTPEELKSWATSDAIHPDELPRVVAAFTHSIESGDPCDIEHRCRRADGVYRWFHARGLPQRDMKGRIVRWYFLLTDIDDRKQAEEKLRRSEAFLRDAQRISGTGSWRHDFSSGRVIVSPELDRIFGIKIDEDAPTSELYFSRIHPEDRKRIQELFERSEIQKTDFQADYRVVLPDGTIKHLHSIGRPILNESSDLVEFVGTTTDITERKVAEELRAERARDVALRADVSMAFSKTNLREMLRDCTEAMVRHLDAASAHIWTVNKVGDLLDLQAGSGMYTNIDGPYSRQPVGELLIGRIAQQRKSYVNNNVPNDPEIIERNWGFQGQAVMAVAGYPLIAGDRVVGVMAVFARTVLTASTLDTLAAVADAISEAIERQRLEGELQHERDRLRLLLDLNNRVASNLDLPQFFHAISSELRRVFNCDSVILALPDPDGANLRVSILDFPDSKGFAREEAVIPIEGSPSGEVFRSGKPLVLNADELNRVSPEIDPAMAEGYQSRCFLPVISRSVVLGTLTVGRISKQGLFTQDEIEFLTQVANQIAITLKNALEYGQLTETKQRLVEQKLYFEDEIRLERNFEEIIGKSPRLKDVLESVQTVAPADSTVLIQGETGTGKELIARAIHELSPRKGQAFVKVNCAAIPSGLLESELFGHEKGAFTGAIAQKIGRFELAHKGTLFLDEIGDIPLELQPKLLRVLQEQEFERLGSTRTQRVDVRLLAATNVGLTQMVAEKKFRSDLYYRLNVFPINVPSLRDRRDDIPLLVRHFANKYARRMGKQIESIPTETMDALSRYAWPGNIRELQNLMERAVLLSKGPSLRVPLGEIFADSDPGAISGGNALEQAEREQIVRALRESNWVVGGARGAAARLGLKRTALAYKMQRFGIVRPPQ
jgi:formate hydrogenlyase transcriptional activator